MRPVAKHYSIRCALRGEPRPGIGRPIAFPRCPDTRRLVAEGSLLFPPSLSSYFHPRLHPTHTMSDRCLGSIQPRSIVRLACSGQHFFLHVQFRVSLSPCIMSFAMVVTLEMIVRTTRLHSEHKDLLLATTLLHDGRLLGLTMLTWLLLNPISITHGMNMFNLSR